MDEINILSFDTSENDLKIGLSINGIDAYCNKSTGLKHIENLIPEINKLLNTIKEDKSKINYISVCTGPGSFTGIRIGIASAEGLSFGNGKKCFGFSVFDIYRYLYRNNDVDIIVPTIDARKNRFYCTFIQKNNFSQMYDLTPEEIIEKLKVYKGKKIIFTGKDFNLFKDKINIDFDYVYEFKQGYSAKDIIDYSKDQILAGVDLNFPKPIYLRKSEAEIEFLKSRNLL
jgi:tRNA threonylcarbamoyladenosine biosynthesis protein TsaB